MRRPPMGMRPLLAGGRWAAATVRLAASASVLALGPAGCDLSVSVPGNPPAHSPVSVSSGRARIGVASGAPAGGNEVPTPPGSPARVVAGAGSPAAAAREFAARYINWTAADVASRLAALARDSVDQARSELGLEAIATRRDRTLHTGRVGNVGAVEAVARLPGRRLSFVVVTRERTTAGNTRSYAGLAASWHVSLATVVRVRLSGARGGWRWAVSDWQPES